MAVSKKRPVDDIIHMDSDLDELFADEALDKEIKSITSNSIEMKIYDNPDDNYDNVTLTGELKNLRNSLIYTKNELEHAQNQIIKLQQQINTDEYQCKKESSVEIERLKSLVEFQSQLIKQNSFVTSFNATKIGDLHENHHVNVQNFDMSLLNKQLPTASDNDLKKKTNFKNYAKICRLKTGNPYQLDNLFDEANISIDYSCTNSNEDNLFIEFHRLISSIKYKSYGQHADNNKVTENTTKKFYSELNNCMNVIVSLNSSKHLNLFFEALTWAITNNIWPLESYLKFIDTMISGLFQNNTLINKQHFLTTLINLINAVLIKTNEHKFIAISIESFMNFSEKFSFDAFLHILNYFLYFVYEWCTIGKQFEDSNYALMILEFFNQIINYIGTKMVFNHCSTIINMGRTYTYDEKSNYNNVPDTKRVKRLITWMSLICSKLNLSHTTSSTKKQKIIHLYSYLNSFFKYYRSII